MKKSVLISIQPYYVFLIIAKLMGWNIPQEKTVEVRKTYPKDALWDKKVIIYCSQNKKSFNRIPKEYQPLMKPFLGKVIGEIMCDYFEEFAVDYRGCFTQNKRIQKDSCLDSSELREYGCDSPFLYAWHIYDLVIYDNPKELWEMCKPCYEDGCEVCRYGVKGCNIHRPPQSWCYVEGME